jgi:hypothetical protein
MFTHPYITGQLVHLRQREKLAHADKRRLGRQLRGHARTSRHTEATGRRLHRALRIALRLPTQAHA